MFQEVASDPAALPGVVISVQGCGNMLGLSVAAFSSIPPGKSIRAKSMHIGKLLLLGLFRRTSQIPRAGFNLHVPALHPDLELVPALARHAMR